MIDFTKLTGIEHGGKVVTQIEDSTGRVLWVVSGGKVVLEVEKITSDTYAGETAYTGEQFILLDIYPKTNGTVKVTYGGLTKTITDTSGAEEPNAQQVFFGTFNGVSDSVETPASGMLTIEGDYKGVGQSYYSKDSKTRSNCECITKIKSLGIIEIIPPNAFSFNLVSSSDPIDIPESVVSIGGLAFSGRLLGRVKIPTGVIHIGINPWAMCSCSNFSVADGNTMYKMDENCLMEIDTGRLIYAFSASGMPSYTTSIDDFAFYRNSIITSVIIPSDVTAIGAFAFAGCSGLTEVIVLATDPPKLANSSAFGNTSVTYPIIVPKGRGEIYKAAETWQKLATRIVEAS